MLVGVLGRRAGMEIDRGQVDRERERGERVGYLRVGARLVRGGQTRPQRYRLKPLGERTDRGYIVVALHMSARARNGNAVENLEEVEVEPVRQRRRGPIGRGQLRPVAKRRLRVAEYLIDRLVESELFRPCVGIALIGKLELVV